MDQNETEARFREQLALEYGCELADFLRPGVRLTAPVQHPERRRYIEGAFFFRMEAFGAGTVICADARLHP